MLQTTAPRRGGASREPSLREQRASPSCPHPPAAGAVTSRLLGRRMATPETWLFISILNEGSPKLKYASSPISLTRDCAPFPPPPRAAREGAPASPALGVPHGRGVPHECALPYSTPVPRRANPHGRPGKRRGWVSTRGLRVRCGARNPGPPSCVGSPGAPGSGEASRSRPAPAAPGRPGPRTRAAGKLAAPAGCAQPPGLKAPRSEAGGGAGAPAADRAACLPGSHRVPPPPAALLALRELAGPGARGSAGLSARRRRGAGMAGGARSSRARLGGRR
ncbi:uncharacterized protein LOC111735576, partial [Pteropus vampyrus]|uniref:Uncharacterized protein LOC111735576 n=1 Tax=Pteropus vampyrus TaxID=132908 RepID=A0A6P6C657_PTEVA